MVPRAQKYVKHAHQARTQVSRVQRSAMPALLVSIPQLARGAVRRVQPARKMTTATLRHRVFRVLAESTQLAGLSLMLFRSVAFHAHMDMWISMVRQHHALHAQLERTLAWARRHARSAQQAQSMTMPGRHCIPLVRSARLAMLDTTRHLVQPCASSVQRATTTMTETRRHRAMVTQTCALRARTQRLDPQVALLVGLGGTIMTVLQ